MGCVGVGGFGRGLSGKSREDAVTGPGRSSTPHSNKSKAAALVAVVIVL